MVSFAAETFCFAYMGLSLPLLKLEINWYFISISMFLILLTRALHVFPLALLCNRFRGYPFKKRHMFIIWFCGLRGAISFSLALSFPSQNRRLIITTTMIIVLFTILLLGGGTYPLLQLIKTEKTKEVWMSRVSQVSGKMRDKTLDAVHSEIK